MDGDGVSYPPSFGIRLFEDLAVSQALSFLGQLKSRLLFYSTSPIWPVNPVGDIFYVIKIVAVLALLPAADLTRQPGRPFTSSASRPPLSKGVAPT